MTDTLQDLDLSLADAVLDKLEPYCDEYGRPKSEECSLPPVAIWIYRHEPCGHTWMLCAGHAGDARADEKAIRRQVRKRGGAMRLPRERPVMERA